MDFYFAILWSEIEVVLDTLALFLAMMNITVNRANCIPFISWFSSAWRRKEEASTAAHCGLFWAATAIPRHKTIFCAQVPQLVSTWGWKMAVATRIMSKVQLLVSLSLFKRVDRLSFLQPDREEWICGLWQAHTRWQIAKIMILPRRFLLLLTRR